MEPVVVIVLPVFNVNIKFPVDTFADTMVAPVAPTATAVPGMP